MQNLSKKCTIWHGKGPKMVNFGPKTPFTAISGPRDPPLADKSGTNGGSLWNTCGGTTLVAKFVRKVHFMAWKGPKNGQFWAKNAIYGHKWPQRPTPG